MCSSPPPCGGGRAVRVARTILGVAVVAAILAACTNAPPSRADPAWVAQVESIIGEASASGADAAQLSALRASEADGGISFEVYADAVAATQQCVVAAGLKIDDSHTTNVQGVMIIDYGWGGSTTLTAEETGAIFDSCRNTNSYWIERAYRTQPTSMSARDRIYDQFRIPLRDCVRSHGVTVADDPTLDDVFTAVGDLLGPSATGPNCMDESGLNAALSGE